MPMTLPVCSLLPRPISSPDAPSMTAGQHLQRPGMCQAIQTSQHLLMPHPAWVLQAGGEGVKALFTEHGEAPAAGQLKRNKDLARTFRTLAEQGAQQGAAPGLATMLLH